MDKKSNVVAVLIVIMVVLALFFALTRFSPITSIHRDQTRQAVTESEIAVRKAVFDGVGNSMRYGLATVDKAWFCNKPMPPSFAEANWSLSHHTNELLSAYFESLRGLGYYAEFDNLSFVIRLPLNKTIEKKIPGYSVIITDLSGSMYFTIDGVQKYFVVRDMNDIIVDTVFAKTPGAKMGLVTYFNHADSVQGLTDQASLLHYSIGNMEAVRSGSTCIACGIYDAVKMLVPPPPPANKPSERPLSIVLMSDGGANTCFDQSNILDECLLLDYQAGTDRCPREQARQQAIEYARQAFERYGISIYTVVFRTDDCPATEPLDCYDPEIMQSIACVAGNCSNYAEGDNQQALSEIYRRYGSAVARYIFRNLTYLRLENDIIYAVSPRVTLGLDQPDLQTRVDLSETQVWPFKTWFLYKNVMNWLILSGEDILRSEYIRDTLTDYRPCKAVFYNSSNNGCPPLGRRQASARQLESMSIMPRDFAPQEFLGELRRSIDSFMNETNITCTAEYLYFNVTNIPVFDYGPMPGLVPVNSPFGNASYRQSGDGTNARVGCPPVGAPPSGREDFLGFSSEYSVGVIGPNYPVSSCTSAQAYEYVGMDRTVAFEVVVRCEDPSLGVIMDGKRTFEPLSLEFVIRVDMMADCDPPLDTIEDVMVC